MYLMPFILRNYEQIITADEPDKKNHQALYTLDLKIMDPRLKQDCMQHAFREITKTPK